MTVIAGISLFDGIMMLADTRVTIQRAGKVVVASDIAQKLVPITNRVIVGFSGDVATAGAILHAAAVSARGRVRQDAYSTLTWLLRFIRHEFQRLKKNRRARPVTFLIGSVLTDRPNFVEREKAVAIFKKYMTDPSVQRSWVSDTLLKVLLTDSRYRYVMLPDTARAELLTVASPTFEARPVAPLEYVAIGSGGGASDEIRRSADWIFGGPTDDHSIRLALTWAVGAFLAQRQEITDVGGMFPCVKLDRRGATFMGGEYGSMGGGTHGAPEYKVSLKYDPSTRRVVQQNHLTGKRIPLAFPWEIKSTMLKDQLRFDDLKDALKGRGMPG